MKNLIVILLCLFLVNCKSSDTTAPDNAVSGLDFIDDNPENLGELAQFLIENFDGIASAHLPYNELANRNSDENLVHVLRGFVNSQLWSKGGNGNYDINSNTSLQAIQDLTAASGDSASARTLCIILIDIYTSFGVPARLVEITGTANPNFPAGYHPVVEVYYKDAWVIADPVLNFVYQVGTQYGDSDNNTHPEQVLAGIDDIIEMQDYRSITWMPQGGFYIGSDIPLGGSYHNHSNDNRLQQPDQFDTIALDLIDNGSFITTSLEDLNRP